MDIITLPESVEHEGEFLNVVLECSHQDKEVIVKRGWLYRPLLPFHVHENFVNVTVQDVIDKVLKIKIPVGYAVHEIDYCLRRECAQIKDDIYYERKLERKKQLELSELKAKSIQKSIHYGT